LVDPLHEEYLSFPAKKVTGMMTMISARGPPCKYTSQARKRKEKKRTEKKKRLRW
jgi:hypothetical protein